jgi:hypothetical protein
METNVFMGYPKRGIACSLNPSKHEQYPSHSLDQNNSTRGVYTIPQSWYCAPSSFVKVTQYLSKFQKIWYATQINYRILEKGYCTFIEYFALWTWVQHELNASKLNWSFVLFSLSTWFATPPPWKILFE